MQSEDGSIIHECLNGETEVFGLLVDKYREGIYAFVYGKLRDFQNAQDVTQEVFLQAYRDLRSLRRWESFVFWLYRIASTRCKLWVRSQSRRVDQEYIADQDPKAMDKLSLDSHSDSQLGESIREALDSLPEMHREVLVLHYFGGMKSKEIARAIGTSPGAIRMRLSRARAQLREEMVDMMDTAFEGQKIPAGFTLHIVEAVKRIKINPMPRVAGLPWGLSLAAGIIMAVLVLNPHMSIPTDMEDPAGFPLPVETKVLKAGEIPVDILKTSRISIISSK
ncbi:RNA polymerase sigma factor [Candidatus Poribacteria bacterium]